MKSKVEALAWKNYVLVRTEADHGRTTVPLTLGAAHELVTQLCEAISNARGHQDVLDGKVGDPSTCPSCKARNITQRHACKKAKAKSAQA